MRSARGEIPGVEPLKVGESRHAKDAVDPEPSLRRRKV
jgi:hypothetical protein